MTKMRKDRRGRGLVVNVTVRPRISVPLTELREVVLVVRH